MNTQIGVFLAQRSCKRYWTKAGTTLVNYHPGSPSLDSGAFPAIPGQAWFCSVSPYEPPLPGTLKGWWAIYFDHKNTGYLDSTSFACRVRCVHSE